MVNEIVNQLLASVVMIDGVAHVPVMIAVEELTPLMVAAGALVAAFCFFLMMLLNCVREIGEILGNWMGDRINARKAAKAEEDEVVVDPRVVKACEALDKVDPEDLKKWFNSRKFTKSE